ncbi:1-deoxy-D-xylulose-5-phosphate synthase [Clostridium sp. SM-530-WT-3G]|uniref:1-deoxy-D-xylulose-5-phosphate synthase n=1 Tax=Clostridium sp. SM-530-WT-3G TaxID=2725303 RepID=UPI00145FBC9A|nr:1-deoxy-D-xylulose-5-phosphate synthase [Clostridium sp. SM-530-WT-3G]NME83195.1 1-deoxy-D-xylulose-5-phosphate synthase [Clostridium sp. SM-530-WT-3G]
MYLENINSPEDLKKLSLDELNALSSEMRETLLEKLSAHGGHIGPNLGTVELIIAMHYVFNSPIDKFVFDVSHQSYVHKMITGRRKAFMEKEAYDEVSGYTNPNESEHDWFNIGHTSTSISLASGLAKGRDLKGDKENIVAVIGDGSLSGGEAFEGLNTVAEIGTNMIVIVNDNDMAIAENHGGLYKNLRDLRESNGTTPCNFFKAMGFEYYYVGEGNNVEALIDTLSKVKDVDHPVLVHIHTIKGKGYEHAEINKEMWHAGGPFDREKGEYLRKMPAETYTSKTAEFLMDAIKKDPTVGVVNAATPGAFGFRKPWRDEAGTQYVDVGIAEEQAVAMVSGMAKNGTKPVLCILSTFAQRTYDQLMQDLCLNNNPAAILNYGASVYSMNDESHLGFFDIAMMSNIPNLVYLAPTSIEEHLAMVKYAMEQTEHPVAVRVPAGPIVSTGKEDTTDYSILNKFEVTKEGKDVAIIGLGNFYKIGEAVSNKLSEEGINATLINPKFITGLDEELLNDLKKNHKMVITLEDGILEGGFGQKIASFYGPSDMKVKNYGIKKSFPDRYVVEELLKENGISVEQIIDDIKKEI